jgi:RNA ligase
MPTHLTDVLDVSLLEQLLRERYVKAQTHPDLPLTIYNYAARAQFDRCWNDVTRSCRGLVVDDEGHVVARPFMKFFNLDEHERTSLPAGVVHVSDKLDGSLGILYPTSEGFGVATRGSFVSEQAVHATRVWKDRYASAFIPNPAWTYLFEIIYPGNKIVVDYQGLDDLVLIAAIETSSGRSVSLSDAAKDWPGPVVEEFPYTSLEEAITAPARNGREGFVVHFLDRDLRLKIKHDDYVRLHHLVTGISERRIWEVLAAGRDLDEWLEAVPDELYAFVTSTRDRLLTEHASLSVEIVRTYDDVIAGMPQGWTRKDFAEAVDATGWSLSRALFLVLDGKPFDHLIWQHLRPEQHIPLFNLTEDRA